MEIDDRHAQIVLERVINARVANGSKQVQNAVPIVVRESRRIGHRVVIAAEEAGEIDLREHLKNNRREFRNVARTRECGRNATGNEGMWRECSNAEGT